MSSVERHRPYLRRRDDVDDVAEGERQGSFREPELGVVVERIRNGLELFCEPVGELGLFHRRNGIGEDDRPSFFHKVLLESAELYRRLWSKSRGLTEEKYQQYSGKRRKPMHITTVCSLVYLFSDQSEVCLPRSLSGPTKGKRSGYGGKQEQGETIRDCAIRETLEESGVRVIELEKRGVVTFHWGSKQEVPGLRVERCMDVEVHVYRSDRWSGPPMETEAFDDPEFFLFDNIPYHEMMPCEELWFAQLLAGNEFTAEMHFRKCDGKIFCREGHLHKRPRHDLLTKP